MELIALISARPRTLLNLPHDFLRPLHCRSDQRAAAWTIARVEQIVRGLEVTRHQNPRDAFAFCSSIAQRSRGARKRQPLSGQLAKKIAIAQLILIGQHNQRFVPQRIAVWHYLTRWRCGDGTQFRG